GVEMKSPNKLDTVTRGRSILTRHASANLSLLSLTALVLVFRAGSARAGWGLPQGGSFPVASLSSQQRLARGKELMKQRKFARAELATNQETAGLQHLRQAYDLSPDSLDYAMALGRLYLKQGRKEAAKPVVEKLTNASSSNPTIELELGGLLLSYGKEEAAVEHLRRVQGVEPKAGEVLYALAVDHFKKQDFRAALRSLELVGR